MTQSFVRINLNHLMQITICFTILGLVHISNFSMALAIEKNATIEIIEDKSFFSGKSAGEVIDSFDPPVICVEPGTKVTWINNGQSVHKIASGNLRNGPTGHFVSNILESGDSYSIVLNNTGEYQYFDTIGSREGYIVVTDFPIGPCRL